MSERLERVQRTVCAAGEAQADFTQVLRLTLADLAGLVAELTPTDVRFVVIGAVAVGAHGHIGATEDLVVQRLPGIRSWQSLRPTPVRRRWQGCHSRLCSRAHLIRMKRARDSLQDRADVAGLELDG